MNQKIFFLILLMVCFQSYGQNERGRVLNAGDSEEKDSIPPVSTYKIISVENDTTHVDTSLTIQKMYNWNYLRKDNFKLLPFSNVGRPYNSLAPDFTDEALFPDFVAGARHLNFMEVEDIAYYRVPTPYTQLFFKTTFEQGQLLDALFTINTSENFNFSLAYKGMRSLGKYQHILTSSGNFRATVNYNTKNERYHLKAHFAAQDLMNQENGGLNPDAVQQYIDENEEFLDRSRLEVNFEDAENILTGKRFFLKHSFDLIEAVDSLSVNEISIGHIIKYSDRAYLFEQATSSPVLGTSYENLGIRDEVSLEKLSNEISVSYVNTFLGRIQGTAGYSHFNYGYNTVLDLEETYIGNRLIGNIFSAGAEFEKEIGEFGVFAEGDLNISGPFEGNNLRAGLFYTFNADTEALFSVQSKSSAPAFNFLLYQSDYVNYNWQNEFANQQMKNVTLSLESDRFFDLDADYTQINNFTFFGLNSEGFVKPFQAESAVSYFKINAQKDIQWKHFGLKNTLLYQKVIEGNTVLNVPDFITRNTLYYSDHWFDRALYLQTGFTFHYFSSYTMDGYDPVLAEFYVQNELEFGSYPRLDFFFNSKIQRTRIFFVLEQVNTLLTGNNNFSAPFYPYRDFSVRFGLVWDFFL